MARRNQIVVQRGEKRVVRVTVEMFETTRQALIVEGSRRGLTIADLVAEALAVRGVNPIRLDNAADAKLCESKGAKS